MAPSSQNPKRKAKENQFPKTGLTLPELGERDEHGLEPMDHLFSSPDKSKSPTVESKQVDVTISEEEDMELVESATPGPVLVLAERQKLGARMPPPRANSPIKTFLQSPARRNPSILPASSPFKGSIVKPRTASRTVSLQKKLELSRTKQPANKNRAAAAELSPAQGTPRDLSPEIFQNSRLAKRTSASQASNHKASRDEVQNNILTNEDSSSPLSSDFDSEVDEAINQSADLPQIELNIEPEKSKKSRAKKLEPTKALAEKSRRQGKDRTNSATMEEFNQSDSRDILPNADKLDGPVSPKSKYKRSNKAPHKNKRSNNLQDDEPTDTEIPEKKKKKLAPKAKTNLIAKKTVVNCAGSSKGPRGPPLPKSKGLLILRRETPEENHGILKTRFGRNSIKPLAFWSNEKVEFEEGELSTKDLTADFTGRNIKHVIRAEEIPHPTKKQKSKSQSQKARKRKLAEDPETDIEEDIEPWEADPGRIIADVRNWDPDEQSGSANDEREEEIALSSAAIITRDIANASFRFAKTITLPFFGAGMVDLPPGSEKKQKNSRKMQMAFFVFYGKVQVTINDNVFRISKGGMWQVPRGNFYGIQNDYDKPARIFFSQGCENEDETTEA
ncbi:unnamed protein product [Blumeria hordei]|uniref:CENP-C homolog n=1 Tax=Blumeria hordei TaxID=2867405 RepID=A0A383V021_BLUHO|nr:unnamed protein product [Blumeria hordei]